MENIIYETPETFKKTIENQNKVLRAMAEFNWNCKIDFNIDNIPIFVLTITPQETEDGVEFRIKLPTLREMGFIKK